MHLLIVVSYGNVTFECRLLGGGHADVSKGKISDILIQGAARIRHCCLALAL